jgi:hypothetical protein
MADEDKTFPQPDLPKLEGPAPTAGPVAASAPATALAAKAPAAPVSLAGVEHFSLGPNISNLDELTKQQAVLLKGKIAQQDRIMAETEEQRRVDTALIHRAYQAEGIGPNELPSWNTQQEMQKYRTDPLEAFGSLASVFGIIAAQFTHAPMLSALEASGAAMQAIHNNDDASYNKAFEAWKQNTTLAINRQKIMHEQYQDAVSMFKTDMEGGRARLEMLATKYGDQATLAYMQAGMDDKAIDLMSKRTALAQKIAEGWPKIEEFNLKRELYRADPDSASPDPRKREEAWRRAWSDEKLGPEQDAYYAYVRKYNPSPEQRAQFIRDMHTFKQGTPEAMAFTAWLAGERSRGHEPTQDEIIEQLRKIREGAGMTEAALDNLVERRLEGDKSVLIGIRQGQQGQANLARFNNRLAQVMAERGITAHELATRDQQYMGGMAYQRTVGTMGARVESASNEVKELLPQALETSRAYPRKKWVPWNVLVQKFDEGTSDLRYNDFIMANTALINAYVRAMNPSGVPRITERLELHAEKILSRATSQAAYEVQLRRLLREITASKRAVAKTREGLPVHGKGEAEDEVPGLTTPPPAETYNYDAQGNRIP